MSNILNKIAHIIYKHYDIQSNYNSTHGMKFRHFKVNQSN